MGLSEDTFIFSLLKEGLRGTYPGLHVGQYYVPDQLDAIPIEHTEARWHKEEIQNIHRYPETVITLK